MRRRDELKRKNKLPPFIPLHKETLRTPAWKALTMGARMLYVHLRGRHFTGFNNNNGRIFLSERDALEELGATNRESIRRWFRELEHFGFIVKTAEHHLGVEGKGKAAQWRLTELEAPLVDPKEPTCDYKKMGRDAIQRQPSLARSRSEAQKTESRTRNNVQDGRETTSSPGRETTSTSPSKWTRKNVHICNPSWTRNNVHI